MSAAQAKRISGITPLSYNWSIKVRVIHMWDVMSFGEKNDSSNASNKAHYSASKKENKGPSFDMVLCDNEV